MKTLAFLLGALTVAAGVDAASDRSLTLQVSNMTCAPIAVRLALERVPGVDAAKVDFKSKRVVVKFDSAKTTPDALMNATADAGFPSTLKQGQ